MANGFYSWRAFLKRVKEIGFLNVADYKNRCKCDLRLHKYPDCYYRGDWQKTGGWKDVLGTTMYSWPEFLACIQKHGITSPREYDAFRKINPRVPCNPRQKYPEWQVLGIWQKNRQYTDNYYSWRAFLKRVKEIGFLNVADYRNRCECDSRLPKWPQDYYKQRWQKTGGWKDVLGTSKYSLPEFLACIQKHGITSQREYKVYCQINPKLPSDPASKYPEWRALGGWRKYHQPYAHYSFDEFQQKVRDLGIRNRRDYKDRCSSDQRMPKSPEWHYQQLRNPGAWRHVLGYEEHWGKGNRGANPKKRSREIYRWDKFVERVREIGFRSENDYLLRYKDIDRCLPGNPWVKYAKEWKQLGGWGPLLGKEVRSTNYYPWDVFVLRVKEMRICRLSDYYAKYRFDPRLPAEPHKIYSKEIRRNGGWVKVFKPEWYTWEDLVSKIKEHNVASHTKYLAVYKLDPRMPSSPRTIYPEKWKHAGGSFKAILES